MKYINMNSLFLVVLIVIGGYLVGSIPTGYMIAKWAGVQDIRNHGSGNIGATNVGRSLGKTFFALVFSIDAGKAYAYMSAVSWYAPEILAIAGIALVLGNVYSLFLGGKGGKGVATSVGVIAFLMPYCLPVMFCIFILIALWTQTVGVASVVAFMMLPFFAYVIYGHTVMSVIVAIFLSLLIPLTHYSNIMHYVRSF